MFFLFFYVFFTIKCIKHIEERVELFSRGGVLLFEDGLFSPIFIRSLSCKPMLSIIYVQDCPFCSVAFVLHSKVPNASIEQDTIARTNVWSAEAFLQYIRARQRRLVHFNLAYNALSDLKPLCS